MYQDILKESWVYQEIGQEFLEQGIEKGREEERQREVQRQSQMLMSFVQTHFPEITALVKQQTEKIKDPEVLQSVILKLIAAQRLDEARQILLDINKSETKH
jgi:predicted transposase YdaD